MAPESEFLGIEVRTVEDVIVARVTKAELWDDRNIDSISADLLHLAESATTPRIDRRLQELQSEGADQKPSQSISVPRIVLDLGAVSWIGSRMIGQIAALHKGIKAAGGRLALCNVNPEITEVIETCRLTTLFSLYPDEASAVASFRA
jgi:anti-anti-sigma regulatory factor